jgi:hypothetical protein
VNVCEILSGVVMLKAAFQEGRVQKVADRASSRS